MSLSISESLISSIGRLYLTYLNNNGQFVNERPAAGTAHIIPLLLALPENGTWFLMARDYSI
jgi:hypothetical protein